MRRVQETLGVRKRGGRNGERAEWRSILNAIISEITAAIYAGYYEVTEKGDLNGCTCNQIWYISVSCIIPVL